MDRLFLDANVLFSAAYKAGADCARLWKLPGVTLLTSPYAVEETRRHLDGERVGRLEFLLRGVRVVADTALAELPEGLELRPKDVPILAAAMRAHATHLVTGDLRDFGRYMGRRLGGVLVVRPRDYFALAEAEMRRRKRKR